MLAPVALAMAMALAISCAHAPPPVSVTWNQIAALPVPPADHRIAYGDDSQQFGELRLPKGAGPFPVVVLVHGGCWRADYDLAHVGPLAGALTSRGFATWTLEYRRLGNPGGGWPGTFEDVARGTDHLRELAKQHPLDLTRVVAMGHSAGGHLALWLAGRPNLAAGSVGASDPLPMRGVVGLAAISDLTEYSRGPSFCMHSAATLMGGSADALADRYAQADPSRLLPLRVPVRLVHGAEDKVVPPEQSRGFEKRAGARGDQVRVETIGGAGHFEVIAPKGEAFDAIVKAVEELAKR